MHSYFADFYVLFKNYFGISSFGAARPFYILKQLVHSTISIKLNKKSLKAETPEAWWPDGVNFLASTKRERNSTVVLKDC